MIKKMMTMGAMLILLCSCGNNKVSITTSVDQEGIDTVELIGQTAVLKYTSGMVAEVDYKHQDTIHWKTFEDGKMTGESDETSAYKRLSANQFMMSWVEKDGTTVCQILDLKAKTITAVLTWDDEKGRTQQVLEGAIEMKGE